MEKIMKTTIKFKVELDDLGFKLGLDHCHEVECEYEIDFSYDRFDRPDIEIICTKLLSITDDKGYEFDGALSDQDMKKVERYLDKAIDKHDFYDDYIAAKEARAESAWENREER